MSLEDLKILAREMLAARVHSERAASLHAEAIVLLRAHGGYVTTSEEQDTRGFRLIGDTKIHIHCGIHGFINGAVQREAHVHPEIGDKVIKLVNDSTYEGRLYEEAKKNFEEAFRSDTIALAEMVLKLA